MTLSVGHTRQEPQIHFSNSPATSIGIAPPPCFFAAPGAPSSFRKIRIARKRTEGARDARGPKGTHGPRRLAASRLVEVLRPPLTLVRANSKANRKSAKT